MECGWSVNCLIKKKIELEALFRSVTHRRDILPTWYNQSHKYTKHAYTCMIFEISALICIMQLNGSITFNWILIFFTLDYSQLHHADLLTIIYHWRLFYIAAYVTSYSFNNAHISKNLKYCISLIRHSCNFSFGPDWHHHKTWSKYRMHSVSPMRRVVL